LVTTTARLREVTVEQSRPGDEAAYRRRVERLLNAAFRLEQREVRDLLALIRQVRARMAVELLAIAPGQQGWRIDQLGQLRAALADVATDLESRYGVLLRSALGTAWEFGAGLPEAALAGANISIRFPLAIDRRQLEVITSLTPQLVRSVTDQFRQRLNSELTLGVLGERSPSDIIRSVQNLLYTQQGRTVRRMGPLGYQAERIVRTEMGRVQALANQVRQQEIADDVPEMHKYWLTAGDGRVRPDHASAGQRYRPGSTPGPIPFSVPYRVGGEQLRYPKDPAGRAAQTVNCRCVSVLYKPEWFKEG
jgi:hypothetical protein